MVYELRREVMKRLEKKTWRWINGAVSKTFAVMTPNETGQL
jgi:hypothetical protein